RTGDPAFPDRVRAHLPQLRAARSWDELEATLARYGLRLERKGQGLVITDGKQRVKASRVARDLSLRRLEQRFGVPYPEREPSARAREPLSPAVEQVTKALDEHERLAALKAERARADQELAAARERLQRLNGAMERVRQASQRLDAGGRGVESLGGLPHALPRPVQSLQALAGGAEFLVGAGALGFEGGEALMFVEGLGHLLHRGTQRLAGARGRLALRVRHAEPLFQAPEREITRHARGLHPLLPVGDHE